MYKQIPGDQKYGSQDLTDKTCILVVDDDEVVRELHQSILEYAGFATMGAEDGERALALLETRMIDLVMTDNQMPRLGGIGLVRRMRAAGYGIPVVMVSGSIVDGTELPDEIRGEVAVILPKAVAFSRVRDAVDTALRLEFEARARFDEEFSPHCRNWRISNARMVSRFPGCAAIISGVRGLFE
jgi:DNA-binding NtrC family response regulator